MAKKILALSEGIDVNGEALGYADALAQRMDGSLVLLLLLSRDLTPSVDEASLLRRGEEVIRQQLEETCIETSSFESHVRTGDPWSELCKFAAMNGPFQMVVWASDSGLSEGRPGWVAGHWAGRIQEGLSCPVITAQRRQSVGSRSNKTRRSETKRR